MKADEAMALLALGLASPFISILFVGTVFKIEEWVEKLWRRF